MKEPHPLEKHQRSLVKITTVLEEPDRYRPWESLAPYDSGGSGCILSGNRILTCAHIISNSVLVQASKLGQSERYTARVLHVDDDRDLAILTVDDDSFFENVTPVQFGSLPDIGSRLSIPPFSLTGNDVIPIMSTVTGIEVQTYSHSRIALPVIRVADKTGPGTSGSPVFTEDAKFVGLAFQSNESGSSGSGITGVLICTPVIEQFFADLCDGEITGVPDLGIRWQKLENSSLREYLAVPASAGGILANRVVYGSTAHGILREGDVILSIDGTPVDSDGTCLLSNHLRLDFSCLISQRQVGERVNISIVRDRNQLDVSLVLRRHVALVPLPEPGRRPSYFIFAGLVFVRLTSDHLSLWDWALVPFRYKHLYYDEDPSATRREVVVVGYVLPHPVNIGYQKMIGMVVKRINGLNIDQMSTVIRAFRTPVDRFHVIEVDNHRPRVTMPEKSEFGSMIVVDAEQAAEASAAILARHGISRDRSGDLEDA